MNKNRIASLLLSAAIASSMMVPAFALEYNYGPVDTGQEFFQATSVGTDAAADSGSIVVGSDGTIGTDEATMPTHSTPKIGRAHV